MNLLNAPEQALYCPTARHPTSIINCLPTSLHRIPGLPIIPPSTTIATSPVKMAKCVRSPCLLHHHACRRLLLFLQLSLPSRPISSPFGDLSEASHHPDTTIAYMIDITMLVACSSIRVMPAFGQHTLLHTGNTGLCRILHPPILLTTNMVASLHAWSLWMPSFALRTRYGTGIIAGGIVIGILGAQLRASSAGASLNGKLRKG